MALSALDDAARQPTDDEVVAILRGAATAWRVLQDWLLTTGHATSLEWGWAGRSFGWSLRAVQDGRRIAYLIPQSDTFLVGLVLGDRPLAAARDAELRPWLRPRPARARG